MDCIFCKIVNKDISSYTIYEDEVVKCFLDIKPINNGHLIIICKKHLIDIEDIDIDTLNHINIISKNMYKLLKNELNFDGLKVVQNNGMNQDVKHYHVHLIPYYKKERPLLSLEEVYQAIKK